jgi:hypothetical protein
MVIPSASIALDYFFFTFYPRGPFINRKGAKGARWAPFCSCGKPCVRPQKIQKKFQKNSKTPKNPGNFAIGDYRKV